MDFIFLMLALPLHRPLHEAAEAGRHRGGAHEPPGRSQGEYRSALRGA